MLQHIPWIVICCSNVENVIDSCSMEMMKKWDWNGTQLAMKWHDNADHFFSKGASIPLHRCAELHNNARVELVVRHSQLINKWTIMTQRNSFNYHYYILLLLHIIVRRMKQWIYWMILWYRLNPQRSFENPHENARQSKTVPMHGLQSRLQYSGRTYIAHAKSQKTSSTPAEQHSEL